MYILSLYIVQPCGNPNKQHFLKGVADELVDHGLFFNSQFIFEIWKLVDQILDEEVSLLQVN